MPTSDSIVVLPDRDGPRMKREIGCPSSLASLVFALTEFSSNPFRLASRRVIFSASSFLLAAAIGRPDLVDDPRFRDNSARVGHREELDAIVAEWMAARPQEEILARLEESGAVAGPVYDVPRILEDPQYAAREDVIPVQDPDLGEIKMVGVVPKFSETPGAVTHPGPRLGAHNHEVYGEWLGLDDAALARLAAEGVV